MKSTLLFVLVFIGSAAAIFFAIAPGSYGAAHWYERYAAAAAERAEQDRLHTAAIAKQQAMDDEIKRFIRELQCDSIRTEQSDQAPSSMIWPLHLLIACALGRTAIFVGLQNEHLSRIISCGCRFGDDFVDRGRSGKGDRP